MTRASRFAGLVSVALAAALLLPPGAPPASARTVATAEHAVGRVETTFVDSSRPTSANGTYAGAPDRTLPMLIMYPAKGTAGGLSTLNAKPARADGPFPLVVFSHGFTASGPAYGEVLLRRIAAHGYIVAAPTFPLTNAKAPGGPKLRDYVNQPQDVSFVIDKMLAMNRRNHMLHGLIDAKEIGAMGHSLGAITTLGVTYNSAHRERRVRAAVAMSGIQFTFPGGSWTWPSVPLLLVHGDKDGTVPYAGSKKAYAEAKAPKFLLTMLGAPHVFFGAPYLDQEVRSIDNFFDSYLRHDRRALQRLERTGNVPGVSTLESDPG
ncbi:MAG: alpha/beta hydrolase family protein [Acidimicrobiia bacterium]